MRLMQLLSLSAVASWIVPTFISVNPSPHGSTTARFADPNDATSKISIFYNVYLAPDRPHHGLSIVKEQLQSLRQPTPNCTSINSTSIHANDISSNSSSSLLSTSTIYYTQIGHTATDMEPLCHPCTPLHKAATGSEQLTLQSMYEHCVAHKSHRVVYLHNKGSFTRSDLNNHLRRVLTLGVTSKECIERPIVPNRSDESYCNICSTQFSPFPIPHTVGNMFVADCDYIRELIPPKDFALRKQQVHDRGYDDIHAGVIQALPRHQRQAYRRAFRKESWSGLNRFAMEQWAYSHPNVQPCDVYRGPEFTYVDVDKKVSSKDLFLPKRQTFVNTRRVEKDSKDRHSWYSLPGRLYEWYHLYNATPPSTSWVWKFYDQTKK